MRADLLRRLEALEKARGAALADQKAELTTDEAQAFIALYAYGTERLTWERYDSDNPHLPEAVKRATYLMAFECRGGIPGLEGLDLEPAPWSLAARRVDEEEQPR
jgi:hypothetical protein